MFYWSPQNSMLYLTLFLHSTSTPFITISKFFVLCLIEKVNKIDFLLFNVIHHLVVHVIILFMAFCNLFIDSSSVYYIVLCLETDLVLYVEVIYQRAVLHLYRFSVPI